ncbi:MAG TPA: hypothetical protein VIJ14_02530 [Rhabdochlamydiaceae bacterium]
MTVPNVGLPGGGRALPVTNKPSKKLDHSDIAENILENPKTGTVDLKNRETKVSPQDETTEQTTEAAFKYFQSINKPSQT